MYDGYFLSYFVNVFSNQIVREYESYGFILANNLFIELIIFLVVRISALVFRGKLAKSQPLANFLNSVRVLLSCWLLFYFTFWGMEHYKLIHNLATFKKDKSFKYFNVVLSWFIAIYVHFECCYTFFEIVYTQYRVKNPAKPTEYKEVATDKSKTENFTPDNKKSTFNY
jgi:hypothetical protein